MPKLIHMMIRVLDEARSVGFYQSVLGLEVSSRLDFDSFTLVYLRNREADFEIELTVNKDRTGDYDPGDGYGHVAVAVDDLEQEHERIHGLGVEATDIKEFFRNGELLARFFFIQDPDGYKIEVLERHGHYQ